MLHLLPKNRSKLQLLRTFSDDVTFEGAASVASGSSTFLSEVTGKYDEGDKLPISDGPQKTPEDEKWPDYA